MSMELNILREDGINFILPGQTFINPKGTLLLTQFQLKPGDEWLAFVYFFKPFSPNDERDIRKLQKDIRHDLTKKYEELKPAQKKAIGSDRVKASKILIDDAIKFFEDHNKWMTGKYTMELKIECEPRKASVKKHFEFTLYETDSNEIKERVEKYKYGDGICWDDKNQISVSANVIELK